MADPSPFKAVADGVHVSIRLTPKASRNHIGGPVAGADGDMALKAAVTAAPENGKANAALIKLLAKEWRVAKTRISVAVGATDRRKTLHLQGDPKALVPHLETWMRSRND